VGLLDPFAGDLRKKRTIRKSTAREKLFVFPYGGELRVYQAIYSVGSFEAF
jgi:hypothetical protein